MLSFLLFAGSIHIYMENIRTERTTIITFSTVGILISTFLIGGMVFLFCKAFQLEVGFIYCLLFGALISPTDPIAVMGILTEANIPKTLET